MSNPLIPSSTRPRRVHASDPNGLLRAWHKLNARQQDEAFALVHGYKQKQMPAVLGRDVTAGALARSRNEIAAIIRNECDDLEGSPQLLITKMIYAVYPDSTDAPPRVPEK